MYEHPLHSEPEAHNTLVVNASQVHSFRRQLTSGAIQYGVPMVVLRLPSVFSTTAEIPRVRKEGRRKGGKKERKKGEWKVRRVSTHTSFFLCSLLPLPNSHSQLTNSSHSPPHQLTPPHLTHSHTPLITWHTPIPPSSPDPLAPPHPTHSPLPSSPSHTLTKVNEFHLSGVG